jgi:DNA-binding protein HU-beta
MNKKDLIQATAEHADNNINHKDIDRVLNHLATAIHEELANNGDVTLPGLGKFSVKQRAERQGRNPATGEAITIPAAIVPVFKAAKGLKEAVTKE